MKNTLITFLTTLILLCISSCKDNSVQYRIGIAQNSDDVWHKVVNDEMKRQAASFENIELDIKSSFNNCELQIKQIEEFIEDNVDLIIVSPNDSDSLNAIISKAYNKGIPVILLNKHIVSDNYTAYIGLENELIGKALAAYAEKKLPKGGNAVIMRGAKQSITSNEWAEGFKNCIESNGKFNIVADVYGNFRDSVAFERMHEIIHSQEDKPIDVVVAMNDMMAIGINNLYADHPELKKPVILGVGGSMGGGGVNAIEDKQIDAEIIYPTEGYKVIILANNILNNLEYEKENPIEIAVADETTIKVLKMQNSQIIERTEKINNLTTMLNRSERAFSQQRTLSTLLIVFVILLIICLITLCYLIVKQRKLYDIIKNKNTEVERQVETLKEQKEQMTELSNQLEDATQAKLMFFTDITHEFKTPLTLILGPVEEMLNSGKLTPEENKSLGIVYRNGAKLMNLLNQILEFRTYENGQMEIQPEMGRLDIFLKEINNMFEPYFKNRKINFEYLTDGNDYSMSFDKDKIDKIYFNLLSNALKFVNPNGTIQVKLTQKYDDAQRYAVLSVFNTGSYIPEDNLQDVYKRFYHIDKDHENSGIGLALTKSLVEAHHGTIDVESNENEGTIFIVTIPIEDATDMIVNETNQGHKFIDSQIKLELENINEINIIESITEDNAEKKPNILIIEDNADMRRYLKLVLNYTYNVIQASDGEEGIKKAITNIPDLIITDIMMPGIDGFEVCRQLRSNVITKKIPIICLTACASDEQKIKSFENGADSYLTKPFNANVLRIRIKKLIEKNTESASSIETELFPGMDNRTLGDKQRQFMNKIKEYVELHIQENISIDELTKELGLSKSSFYRQLKEITDYNPVDIISLIKLKAGLKLMLVNHQSITEAAYATGFSSSSYFAKIFYKFYNETPSKYLKRYMKRTD